ncbi:Aldehyde/histidinol dehydrogenase [Penicillium chermesinum]|uniref:Aldehyde dehydrogenase n=1 Tax=Penicillium chermesinum TaxID=63820 RepID=A0A9W9P696_9EURO|nr:Aldehyde/histidinol dehydrogenase [Penicillium chermesinum]KAJ5238410.1 Aldehyde/histidinol dehydrogenase [Penicillium chermesinum]
MGTYTSAEEVNNTYARLRDTFQSGKTKSVEWRKWQLKQLWWLVSDNKDRFLDALHKDCNRSAYESLVSEYTGILNEILYHLQNVDQWIKPRRPDDGSLPMTLLAGASLRPEPRGLVLIIGPWNFPVSLLLRPLVAAITAGCTAILKPSELTQASQACLVELVPQYLDTDAISIVTGGPGETTSLLQNKQFDLIFFTGSPAVGRLVAEAAAKHLTPVVLELGGQGPGIVTASADIDFAAKSIASTKYMNAGQSCLAVNHVLAHPSVAEQLVELLKFHFEAFAADGPDSMTAVINKKNFDRLKNSIEKSHGTVVYGGQADPDKLSIRPTILTDLTPNDPILSSEIFGPICPILITTTEDAIRSINSTHCQLTVITSTTSGGVTVNDTLVHAAVLGAPFGGIGESGYGTYHGAYGFKAFSHMRTIANTTGLIRSLFGVRYPPYSKKDPNRLAVKNSLGFKRGETILDQRIGLAGWFRDQSAKIIRLTLLSTLFVLADKGAGGWLGLHRSMTYAASVIKSLAVSVVKVIQKRAL